MSTVYVKHLSEPWFSLVKLGIKKVEGRLNKGDFAKMRVGDVILFTNSDFGLQRTYSTKIEKIANYNSFFEYLSSEKLEDCLPGIDCIGDGVQVYYAYLSKSDEETYKVRAFHIQDMTC